MSGQKSPVFNLKKCHVSSLGQMLVNSWINPGVFLIGHIHLSYTGLSSLISLNVIVAAHAIVAKDIENGI